MISIFVFFPPRRLCFSEPDDTQLIHAGVPPSQTEPLPQPVFQHVVVIHGSITRANSDPETAMANMYMCQRANEIERRDREQQEIEEELSYDDSPNPNPECYQDPDSETQTKRCVMQRAVRPANAVRRMVSRQRASNYECLHEELPPYEEMSSASNGYNYNDDMHQPGNSANGFGLYDTMDSHNNFCDPPPPYSVT